MTDTAAIDGWIDGLTEAERDEIRSTRTLSPKAAAGLNAIGISTATPGFQGGPEVRADELWFTVPDAVWERVANR
ncbi:hypothetical protein GCM10009613_61460 [Pseudonocardia kongjuensis]|uniref:Uncharacterized protein n=1 Tax=Pseudonocardia kongjuensis TaxID=102227 RepID=A0ABN1YBU2_9PSEU